MSKAKRIGYFSIPILMTIYQVYLINRIWHFSTRISLFMGTILLGILYTIFYLFYKKIKYNDIKKKNFINIIIVSIVLSCTVLGTNFDFFSKTYRETNVKIYQENSENDLNNSIKNIYIDGTLRKKEDYINGNTLEMNLKSCKDIKIVFEINDQNRYENLVILDGDMEKVVNLSGNYYIYNVEGNKVTNVNSIIRLIISFFMIEILLLMACIASYKMYKDNKSIIIPVLLLILAIRIFVYQQNQLCVTYDDSFDYQNCGLNKIIKTKALQGRVPVYPFLIQFIEFICNDMWAHFICILQMIISFISLIYLYKVLKLITKREIVSAIVVFLYGISTAIIGWDTIVLTESLSLSAVVFLIYMLISYLKTNNLKYGIGSTMVCFFLCFLRPSCIAFIPVLACFYILKLFYEKKHRKNNTKCLISVCLITGVLLIYAFIFYKQHETFSITTVSVRQDLYICIHEGFYKNSGDNQFIQDVDKALSENKEKWDVVSEILSKYRNKKLIELTKESKKQSFKDYIKYLFRTVKEQTNEKFKAYSKLLIPDAEYKIENVIYKVIEETFIIKFTTIFIIVAIEGFISFYKWIKNGKPSWIHLGLFGFVFVILVTAFIGTNAEFMRTSICALPFVYISIANLISDVIEKINSNNKKSNVKLSN